MLPNKRRRLNIDDHGDSAEGHESLASVKERSSTLDAPISPPSTKSATKAPNGDAGIPLDGRNSNAEASSSRQKYRKSVPSPVQLVRVSDLNKADNTDTVGIEDLLGDPLIKECWAFNYLFDVEWLLTKLDEDVRDQVRVMIVHGSWKRDNQNKIAIDEAAKAHQNVRAITAYMPDPFGTHHTKMLILIRHDDAAEVIIFTANLIPRDWRMCQAVWRSHLLPLKQSDLANYTTKPPPFGTGDRFQFDLISYLNAYGAKLKELSNALKLYDFSTVKGALIASTPSRQYVEDLDLDTKTLWGWPALQESLKRVPVTAGTKGHIVAQVSSIATLGVEPTWLYGTLYRAFYGSDKSTASFSRGSIHGSKPNLSIVFPTAEEIRRTIDGYFCGASIHMKLQTAANQKQLKYLIPHLCHWSGDTQPEKLIGLKHIHEAGRKRTGPHIKTYVRFTDDKMETIDWTLMTSANLSKQAWGTERNAVGEIKISSFEVGVLHWPELWKEGDLQTRMVPVFKRNIPTISTGKDEDHYGGVEIGWRMPYNLPLIPYDDDEKPWCATQPHLEPDNRGGVWTG